MEECFFVSVTHLSTWYWPGFSVRKRRNPQRWGRWGFVQREKKDWVTGWFNTKRICIRICTRICTRTMRICTRTMKICTRTMRICTSQRERKDWIPGWLNTGCCSFDLNSTQSKSVLMRHRAHRDDDDDVDDLYIIGAVCLSVCHKSHYFCIQRIWSFLMFIDAFRIQGIWLFLLFLDTFRIQDILSFLLFIDTFRIQDI